MIVDPHVALLLALGNPAALIDKVRGCLVGKVRRAARVVGELALPHAIDDVPDPLVGRAVLLVAEQLTRPRHPRSELARGCDDLTDAVAITASVQAVPDDVRHSSLTLRAFARGLAEDGADREIAV
jgi:hypothetical protein